jgi:hypothetical protein
MTMKKNSSGSANKPMRMFLYIVLGLTALCLAGAGISALSNRFLPQTPADTGQISELDKQRLAEAIHLRQALGDQVWPAFGQMDIPLILWNHDYSFLVGPAQLPQGWEVMTGDDFQGRPYFRQKSDDPQNFAVRVGDVWAASMATKSETDAFLMQVFRDLLPPLVEGIFPYRLLIQPSEVQISAVAHESFHVFQQRRAPERLAAAEQAHQLGERYWLTDPAMEEDWRKEIELMYQAVQAEADDEAARLARAFLDQRQSRRTRAALSADLVDFERQLEWEEGLAKYIELAIWRAGFASPDFQPILSGDPDFKGYHKFPGRLKQELSQMKRQAGQAGEARFYYTGMAQALLLDRLNPGWQEKALQEGVWVEDLLAEALQ